MLEDELSLLEARKNLLDTISEDVKKRLQRVKDAVNIPKMP